MDKTLLQNTVLFRGLRAAEIDQALTALDAREKSYQKGALVCRAGSETERIGLVLSGSVTVERNDIWGNRTILDLIGCGGFFAETYAILRREPMLVDVAANTDCRVLFLRVGPLLDDTAVQPWENQLLRNLLIVLSHKNLALSGRSFHTSSKTARGRIMAYLHSVSLQAQRKTFDIPFDRQQMADYLNLERTALSKELGKMQRDGMIRFRKKHFTIL